jgi:hypothetical protein
MKSLSGDEAAEPKAPRRSRERGSATISSTPLQSSSHLSRASPSSAIFEIEMLPAENGDCLWIEYGDPERPHRIVFPTTSTAFYHWPPTGVCAAASPDQSGPPPGSRRSPVANGQASASPPASCAYSPAAARTGTSSTPSHGSTRIPGPPHDGYGPRRKQNAGQRRTLPRQTSRPTPKGTSLATGRLLRRPRRHYAGAPWPILPPPSTHALGIGNALRSDSCGCG